MNNSASVTESLIQFRDAGIQVAIDDFGTGYSSLAYLNKFDIDYLKIDQSFVRNLAPDSSDRALCEAIVGMAHSLGLLVIAEGVETAQQRDLLKDLHCDFAQGYLYSKPVPASQFEAYLDSIA
jgi:EAL domain-containing protein (putative c-di-GMP-specific phosphodiesterase class I)